MKFRLYNSRKAKWLFWFSLLLITATHYYYEFFELFQALVLGIVLCGQVALMIFVGYQILSKQHRFPRFKFWLWVLLFSLVRYLIIYFILQYKLPDYTVFHYPNRSIFFVILTSACLVFFGYSLAIYEWGLAAKQRFRDIPKTKTTITDHPIIIRSNGKSVYLLPADIYYLKANGEYIEYHSKNGKYLCFQRLKIAEKELKKFGFIRVHRSYIINPEQAVAYSNTNVALNNNINIPVSKTYRAGIEHYIS